MNIPHTLEVRTTTGPGGNWRPAADVAELRLFPEAGGHILAEAFDLCIGSQAAIRDAAANIERPDVRT